MKYSHEAYEKAIKRAKKKAQIERDRVIRARYDEAIRRALARFDDEEERGNQEQKGGHGNTRLPFGLCKKFGIDLPEGAKPHDAWEALKGKGITPDEAYTELKETGSAEGIGEHGTEQEQPQEPVEELAQEVASEPAQEPAEAQEQPSQEAQETEQNEPQNAPESAEGGNGEQETKKEVGQASAETVKKVADMNDGLQKMYESDEWENAVKSSKAFEKQGDEFEKFLKDIPEGAVIYWPDKQVLRKPEIKDGEPTGNFVGGTAPEPGYGVYLSAFYGGYGKARIMTAQDLNRELAGAFDREYEELTGKVSEAARAALDALERGDDDVAITNGIQKAWNDGGEIWRTQRCLADLTGRTPETDEMNEKRQRLEKDIRLLNKVALNADNIIGNSNTYRQLGGNQKTLKSHFLKSSYSFKQLLNYINDDTVAINHDPVDDEEAWQSGLAQYRDKAMEVAKKTVAKALAWNDPIDESLSGDELLRKNNDEFKAEIDKELSLVKKGIDKCDKLAAAGDKDGERSEAWKVSDRLAKLNKALSENVYKGLYNVGDKCEAQRAEIQNCRDAAKRHYTRTPVQEKYGLPDLPIDEKNGAKGFSDDCYSVERKDNATWCKSPKGSLEAYGNQACDVFKGASEAEREAIYDYTAGSGKFNRPLSGYHGTWAKQDFRGIGKANLDHEGGAKKIRELTNVIGRSEFDKDIWVQRGTTKDGIEAFLGMPLSEGNLETLIASGEECHWSGFMSCGAARDTGFSDCNYILNVYCPKGTKGAYIAPGSQYGGSADFTGTPPPEPHAGHENELLLQRDGNYRVTKYEKKGNKWYLDVEVTSQEPIDYKNYVYHKPE